jgi:hypothetical protein
MILVDLTRNISRDWVYRGGTLIADIIEYRKRYASEGRHRRVRYSSVLRNRRKESRYAGEFRISLSLKQNPSLLPLLQVLS